MTGKAKREDRMASDIYPEAPQDMPSLVLLATPNSYGGTREF